MKRNSQKKSPEIIVKQNRKSLENGNFRLKKSLLTFSHDKEQKKHGWCQLNLENDALNNFFLPDSWENVIILSFSMWTENFPLLNLLLEENLSLSTLISHISIISSLTYQYNVWYRFVSS